MSSLLTFAMKRRKGSSSKDNNSSAVPEVSPTSSAETVPSSSDDVLNCSFYTAEAWQSPIHAVPLTPEGLRPRKPLDELREELDIPPARGISLPSLPPRPNMIASPQISNSSFYSRTTSGTLVAESPDLSIGRARTAVGALIAQRNQQQASSSNTTNRPPLRRSQSENLGVLPPRDWLKTKNVEEEEEEAPYHRLDDSMEVVTPNRARRSFMSVSPGSTADASSIHASPSTWRHYQQYQDENYARSQQQRTDVNVSFSSRLGLVQDRSVHENNQAYNFDPIHVESSESRDDAPPGGEYVVAASDNLTNVSGISHSTTGGGPIERWTWGITDDKSLGSSSRNSYDGYNGQDAMDSALLQHKAANQRKNKERLVISLIQRLQDDTNIVADVNNIKSYDETLNCMFVDTPMDAEGLLTGYAKGNRLRLLNAISKLLHEMEVAHPEEFFMSPTQIPIIADSHFDLREALRFLHCIIRTAIPENERGQESTEKLAHGTSESPVGPKPRWTAKGWLRSSLGINSIPESPQTVRGGDTSLFSLPSDSCDTPHTSNVSMTTTITSRNSPDDLPSAPPQQATKVRRTIEIASTLVQKMTLACNQLLLLERCSSQESIRATEEIKRNYLQLMSLSHGEVSALVSAFTQEEPPQVAITRIVSEDDNENNIEPDKEQAPVTSREIVPRPLAMAEMESSISICDSRTVSFNDHSRDFFSPRTEDMESYAPIEEDDRNYYNDDSRLDYVEDLRREVGSFDDGERGGDDCEREGPPQDSSTTDSSQMNSESGAFPSMPMYYETVARLSTKEI